jgi:hypothetical protein
MGSLAFDPRIPIALWLPLAVVSGMLLGLYGLASRKRLPAGRRLMVLVLMSAALALPLTILLNPLWIEPIPPPAGKPQLTVLVDSSASMATRDKGSTASRFEAASLLALATENLKDRFDVRLRTFAETTSAAGTSEFSVLPGRKPDGNSTNLAAAIEQSLEDRVQGQAILLLSDGIHNAGGGAGRVLESVEKARAMAAPIYVTTIGGAAEVRDIDVWLAVPQEIAFVNQQVPVNLIIRERGSFGGSLPVALTLNGQQVEQRNVTLQPNAMTDAVFRIGQKQPGLYRYEFQAAPQPGEVTSVNNRATFLLRVIDEPVRVLLLEGKPYWDAKFLNRTLAADASIELTSVTRMTPNRFLVRSISRAKPPADPSLKAGESSSNADAATSGEKWKICTSIPSLFEECGGLQSYQIIVLGRDTEAYFQDDSVPQLKKWLTDHEGSLVCFRGAPAAQVSQRLNELMPVAWSASRESRYRVKMTLEGLSMGWLPQTDTETSDVLTALPSLATASQPERLKPLAVVLATTMADDGHPTPVITYQPVGRGRVVVVEGTGMWRWAFLPPQHQQQHDIYGTLWRSLMRWLVSNIALLPTQSTSLRSDKVTFPATEAATATLIVKDTAKAGKPPEVELSRDRFATTQRIVPQPVGDLPNQFRVTFGTLPEGQYEARVAGSADTAARTAFDVRGNLSERLDVAARPDLMRRIAMESGGAVLTAANLDQLTGHFDRYLSDARPPRSSRTPAWDRWWVLAGLLAVWCVAWSIRRQSGLV